MKRLTFYEQIFVMTHLPGRLKIHFLLAAVVLTSMFSLACQPLHANAATSVCPFCSAVALTFTEQLNEKDVAVVAKLVVAPPPPTADSDDFPDGQFEIVGVLKGGDIVTTGMTFSTQLVGVYPIGQKFLVMGQGVPDVAWTTPMKASDRVFEYLKTIRGLPAKGPERLTFFQDYFEDKEKILAFDAYDEFASAPYEDLIAMRDQMDREKLLGFIKSPKTTVNRRRLYFTMLGVCGEPEDVKMLEGFIKSGNRKQQAGLDALVGCYLTLAGEKGLPLIGKQFLTNPKADYVDISQVVDALRFHATEAEVIKTEDIVSQVRVLLDHPDHADIIIEDLARWKDWTVMDKLVQMFKDADQDSNWQRVPIITYLRACPKPEAKKHIEELKKIDAQAVERADFYLGIGDSDDDWNDDEPAKEKEADDKTDDAKEADETPAVIVDSDVTQASFNRKSDDLDNQPVANATANYVSVARVAPDSNTTKRENNGEPERDANTSPSELRLASASKIPSAETNTSANTSGSSIGLLVRILLIPMAMSFLILGLMWSVVNGWFERLIF